MLAVRWYLRFALSYRDVEELLAERDIEVDHVTVYRWVQRFTPLLVDAARPCRHRPGDRWFVDETYVKISGRWTYLHRAVDQHGHVIDVLASERRDQAAARKFFTAALSHGRRPVEVTTDKAPVYPRVLDELLPGARHVDAARENNRIESDHSRLKARLRPMRGLKRLRSAQTISVGHGRVTGAHCCVPVPSEPCVRLPTHTAQAAHFGFAVSAVAVRVNCVCCRVGGGRSQRACISPCAWFGSCLCGVQPGRPRFL
ncbi:Transposase (or an inactivated derivative) [Parafrankia irregularis]|uniref:Transposase (Or an inactivated derivative) n=1 Tax=Parafrankia irregularis TaxID=795642 RepID=A0A0S4QXM0_9ACTN|nr:Transposase (or an inactivated derivative) [Parafrankia irregularis]